MADKTNFPKNSIDCNNVTEGLGSLEEKFPKEDGLFFSRLNWKINDKTENIIKPDVGNRRKNFSLQSF